MRRDRRLMATLCLLVSLLAVAMATEDKTVQGALPPSENNQIQSSPKLGPEYERHTTGSATAAGEGVSQNGEGQMPPAAPNEKKPSSVTALPYHLDEDHGTGRLLVAVARTLVTTTASTTTITVLSTCHNTVPGAGGGTPLPTTACTGRKKRKLVYFSQANSEAGLDPSIEGGPVLVDKRNVRAGRFILWSSSVTTVTIRTTSTNAATTVTALFTCLAPGLVGCG